MSEEKEKMIDRIGNSVVDFVGKILGESAQDKVTDARAKAKNIGSDGLKKILEFTDTIIGELDLKENEQVKSAREKVEDFLKEQGLME